MASNVKNLPLSVIIAAMDGDGQALGGCSRSLPAVHTQFGNTDAYRRIR